MPPKYKSTNGKKRWYKPTAFRRGNKSTRMYNTRYPRRANMGSQITQINGVGPVASKMITTLKYCETFYTNDAGGVGFNYIFNLNSTFDPDRTGTGHQPYGRDSLAGMYARYRVYRARWVISAVVQSTDGALRVMNGQVEPQNHAASPGNFAAGSERPRCVTKIINSAGSPHTVFSGSIYLPELTGETSEQYRTNQQNEALSTANPTTVMTLRFTTDNPTGSTQCNVSWNIMLEYDVEWFDPVSLGQS